jgi:hypothetical protein
MSLRKDQATSPRPVRDMKSATKTLLHAIGITLLTGALASAGQTTTYRGTGRTIETTTFRVVVTVAKTRSPEQVRVGWHAVLANGAIETFTGLGESQGNQLRATVWPLNARGAIGALVGLTEGQPVPFQLQLQVSPANGRWRARLLDRGKLHRLSAGKLPLPAAPPSERTFPASTAVASEAFHTSLKERLRGLAGDRVGAVPAVAFIRGRTDDRAVHPSDVEQGQVGDCFLLAALIALAEVQPKQIEKMIYPHGDGTWSVALYDKRGNRKLYRVDNRFRLDPKGPGGIGAVFAHYGDADRRAVANGVSFGKKTRVFEVWPGLIEKAYALRVGGFDTLDWGGHGEEALLALTGRRAKVRKVKSLSIHQLDRLLASAIEERRPITIEMARDDSPYQKKAGVVAKHAYALIAHVGNRFRLVDPQRSTRFQRDAMTAAELKHFFPKGRLIVGAAQ